MAPGQAASSSSEPPRPAVLSLEAHHSDWREALNLARAGGDGPLDAAACALALAAAGLAWRQLPQPGTPGHLFSLLCLGFVLVSSLGAAHWRRLHPASYAAHREWRLACARVCLSGAPACWLLTQRTLGSLAAGGGAAGAAAVWALAVALASWAVPAALQALGQPIRMRYHLPAQATLLLLAARRNPQLCATAALQRPVPAALTAAAYRWLSCAAAALLPFSASARARRSALPLKPPLQQCTALLSFAQLLLGLLLPTAALAAAEARFCDEHDRLRRQHLRHLAHHAQQHAQRAQQVQQAQPDRRQHSTDLPAAQGRPAEAERRGRVRRWRMAAARKFFATLGDPSPADLLLGPLLASLAAAAVWDALAAAL